MCQVHNFLWPLREPLICYKVLNHTRIGNDYIYSSIYWYHAWIKGFINDTNCIIKYKNGKIDEDFYWSKIEDGFYHGFTELEDAEKELVYIRNRSTYIKAYEYVIAKMIIPVTDNICFMGQYGFIPPIKQTVAAKKMIFDSIIETE